MTIAIIQQYAMLQEIKQASTEHNAVLEYKIKTTAAQLESLGVNVENLNL